LAARSAALRLAGG
jgi:hypothetical protein